MQFCRRLCGQKNGEACNQLGVLIVQRTQGHDSQSQAYEFFKKGCSLGSSLACQNAASSCPAFAFGLPQMIAKERCALGFYEKACKLAQSSQQKMNACKAVKRAQYMIDRLEKMQKGVE